MAGRPLPTANVGIDYDVMESIFVCVNATNDSAPD